MVPGQQRVERNLAVAEGGGLESCGHWCSQLGPVRAGGGFEGVLWRRHGGGRVVIQGGGRMVIQGDVLKNAKINYNKKSRGTGKIIFVYLLYPQHFSLPSRLVHVINK